MGINKITREMETAVEKKIFPGAVLLCARGQSIVYHKAFGMADIFEKKKMMKDSIFDLASLTKPLATALAAVRMMETDKMLLNRSIGDILNSFENSAKTSITIDMLLRHRSGFPPHQAFFYEIRKEKKNYRSRLRQLLVKEPLIDPPGKKETYSDLGFMVLAWCIEMLTRQRLDRFVSSQIYKPLGLDTLFFIPFEKKVEMVDKYRNKLVATQQCPWRGKLLLGEVDDENAWSVGGVEGHAGLFGDAFSVFTICSQVLSALEGDHTSIFDPDIINTFVQKKEGTCKVAGFDTPSDVNSSSGQYFSNASIGHLGFTGTSFWIDPETSLIVILLTNRVHPSRANEQIKKFRPQIHDLIIGQLI